MDPTIKTNTPSLGDRYAEISVIIVTIVALFFGWVLMNNVESRSAAFESNGIKAQIPSGWMTSSAKNGEILSSTDITSVGFSTTYSISTFPVAEGTKPSEAASLLTLMYGPKLTVFRVLDQEDVNVNGRDGYKLNYVYVDSDANITNSKLPVVVHGVDYIFVNGGKAIVVSYRASETNFQSDFDRFRRFLESVSF
jgi:hypothetical protein